MFTIPWNNPSDVCLVKIFAKYLTLLPVTHGKFFKRYLFTSKEFTNQNAGRNTLEKTAFHVAVFLKKKHPTRYTSHSFRRSCATALADSGVNIFRVTCLSKSLLYVIFFRFHQN